MVTDDITMCLPYEIKSTLQGCNMLMDTPIYTFICVQGSARAEMWTENGWLENKLKWLPLKSGVASTLAIPSRDASLSFPLDRVLLCSPGWPVTCDSLASGPQVWDYRHSSLMTGSSQWFLILSKGGPTELENHNTFFFFFFGQWGMA